MFSDHLVEQGPRCCERRRRRRGRRSRHCRSSLRARGVPGVAGRRTVAGVAGVAGVIGVAYLPVEYAIVSLGPHSSPFYNVAQKNTSGKSRQWRKEIQEHKELLEVKEKQYQQGQQEQ